MITEDELEALTDYLTDLEREVDYLRRERILYREGLEALERETRNQPDVLAPLPAGVGYGSAGQVIGLTYEAAQGMAPFWFKPTLRKTTKKPGGD
jgi:hypothetical protein